MILKFRLCGAKVDTLIRLVAHKFSISQSLAREVIDCTSKAKSYFLRSLEMEKQSKKREDSTSKLKKWEEIANSSNHNYADEVFIVLLDEEAKQETTWDIIGEDVTDLAVFAPQRRMCVRLLTSFSVK